MLTALAAALLGSSAGVARCTPVPGADRLWQPETRWVVVGEMHGTMQTPDAFANLVCLAAATGRPVTVALEYAQDGQAVIDTWLASDGGPQARARLLDLPLFTDPRQYGVSSVAFARLFEQLRQMKKLGLIQGVAASDVPWRASAPAGQDPNAWRNAIMARNWLAVPAPDNGLVLALVGNIHAIDKPATIELPYVPAAAQLPRARTTTVNVYADGGQAWNCQDDGCKPHDYDIHTGRGPIVIVATPEATRPWDYTYRLGVPFTPAVPAVASDDPIARR